MYFKNSKNNHVICVGDTTDHGGVVLNGSPTMMVMGRRVARVGDMVTCPKCDGTFPIVEGDTIVRSEGHPVAFEGHHTACGARLLSNIGGSEASPAFPSSFRSAGINSLHDGVVADSGSGADAAIQALDDAAKREAAAYEASYQRDVARIYDFYRKAIAEMDSMGLRRPGKGPVNALLNNVLGDGTPGGAVVEALGGQSYLRCYPQVEFIKDRLPAFYPQLELVWSFRIAESSSHYWYEAVPQADASMVVFMDPLYDDIHLTPKRTDRFTNEYPNRFSNRR